MIFGKKKTIKNILFVATEAAPFVKAGGLGEVMYSLPKALKKLGYDARLMIPKYASIDNDKFNMEMEFEKLSVPTGDESQTNHSPEFLICNVKTYVPEKNEHNGRNPVKTYFLENLEYYEKRSNIYGYNDDAIRWALLCRGVLEFLRASSWMPDIIVASDWQTGFLCNYLKTAYHEDEKLKNIATVFVIHNLSYQGMFDHRFISEMDADDGHSPMPSFFSERLLKINGMRRGILHSDTISTVSPTYAKEIMTKEYGELLEDLLRERRSRVYGILNGIDYEEFNPQEDKYLQENYNKDKLGARVRNKLELQSRFGLDKDKNKFLISIASRLSGQKGFDLLFPVIDVLLDELNIQLAVLGAGDRSVMEFFKKLEEKYPGKVGVNLSFDTVLPHLIHSGADAILIPSKFEPAGLLQLEAMRYGAVPIVRKTGGLADTVEDFDTQTSEGTGFVFNKYNSYAMMVAIIRAYEIYMQKNIWKILQKNAMKQDFSWAYSAREYARVFEIARSFKRRESEE